MREQLEKLLNNSYSPYSKFKVSAIVTMKDGNTFSGVNVENASYGATICAEKSAIASAITNGYKKHDFEKLYIMVDRDKVSTCCFLCRQLLHEFFEEDKEIIMMSKKDELRLKVKDLCPYSFGEEDLK